MLHEVDNTIAQLLKSRLPPDLGGKLSICFATPGAGFPPPELKLPAVNLYLYSAIPNYSLRENAPTVHRSADGTAQRIPPPICVDCTYLVSIWTEANDKDPSAEEHGIYGTVLQALLGNPVIPQETLQGSLQNSQAGPVTTRVSQAYTQSPGNVRPALGAENKLSFSYTVTFSMPVFAAEPVTLVTDKQIKIRTMELQATQ
ncbi:MAG TPA: DUF4255 domain-containing protein [Bryocella sp.]|nr:DUF4255 domain-containing protein [Bryocella sp.]